MRSLRPHLQIPLLCCLAATVSLFVSQTGTAVARQSGAPKGPPPGGPNLKAETRQKEMRETMLRNAESGAAIGVSGGKRDEKRIEAAIEQMKQDFRQIQIVRNELVRNLLSEKPLDFKLVSDKAAEINKRADRLKTYLIPPSAEAKEKNEKPHVEFNQDQMKGALVQLCNRIALFIDSPALKTPGTVDVEQATKTGGELLSIIELSGNIKRSAEKLSKVSK
jgi:hypothetical protein